MKVAFLLATYPKLSETFIRDQVQRLSEKLEVRVYAFSFEEEPVVMNSVRYIPGQRRRLILRYWMQLLRLRNVAREQGLRLSSISKELRRAMALKRAGGLAELERSDIVVAHYGTIGLVAAIANIMFDASINFVTFVHGYDVSKTPLQRGFGIYRMMFQEARSIIAVSEYWKTELIRLGCPRDKVQVHHLGTEIPVELPEFDAECMQIVSVGRLVEKKGTEYLLRALPSVFKRFPDASVVIVGNGPLRPQLEELCHTLGISESVTFSGAVSHNGVRQAIQSSRLFVLPSVTSDSGDKEGIPVSIMEAMALGVPVVSTRHSGIPEIVSTESKGTLVPERDVDRLSEAIVQGLSDSEWSQSVRQEAYTYVASEFNLEKQSNRLITLLRNMAN